MKPGGGGGGDDNGRTGHQRDEIINRENKKARTINRFLEAREISVKRQRVSDAAMNAFNRPAPVELPKHVVYVGDVPMQKNVRITTFTPDLVEVIRREQGTYDWIFDETQPPGEQWYWDLSTVRKW